MCTFTPESTHFIFNKGPIYTHDGASAKFITSLDETDYSAESFNSNKKGAQLPLLSAEGCHSRLDGPRCPLITYQGVFFKG
jgi:hypothetical protein